MDGGICCQVDVHPVTKSSLSPGASFLQPPPHGPDVSRKLLKQRAISFVLYNLFLAVYLYDGVIVKALWNVISCFLVSDSTFISGYYGMTSKPELLAHQPCIFSLLFCWFQAVNEEDIYAIQHGKALFPIGCFHVSCPAFFLLRFRWSFADISFYAAIYVSGSLFVQSYTLKMCI
ncbi:uncharacterized protein LOC121796518 [Salvia splendens]|uniref:uncharacterized protein LOC121796518 n=1 Tax=Salvia splendens TaxID=180675 RepID=UPI001C256F6C|nr:uncharacterized protein LOC121796518 [Salvia splendens]